VLTRGVCVCVTAIIVYPRLQLEKFRTVITDGRSNADTRDNNILLNSEEKLTALTSDLNQAITQVYHNEATAARVLGIL